MNDIPAANTVAPGLAARRGAAELLGAVLTRRRPLDEAITVEMATGHLAAASPRDRAFARQIAATTLRRLGTIDHAIGRLLDRELPKRAGATQNILRAGAAEMLFLGVAPHAAVSMAVEAAARDGAARGISRRWSMRCCAGCRARAPR